MRFFFSLAGAVYDPDNEGIELADISTARIMGVQYASELLRDRPELAWLGEEMRVEVTDKDQQLLFTVLTVGVDGPGAKGLA